MLHRARSTGPSSAERVAGLLTPVRGGWVPPAEPDPEPGADADGLGGLDDVQPLDRTDRLDGLDHLHGRDGLDGLDRPDDPARTDATDAAPSAGSPREPLERSWSAQGRRRAPAPPAGRWRLDVGRGAVAGLLVVAALAATAAAGVVLHGRPQEVPVPAVAVVGTPLPGASASPEPTGQVVVAVAGEVRTPGLVRLPAGSRVDDAVRAAGGPLTAASTGLLNLARVLVDGEQVLVGVEPPPGTPTGGGGSTAPGGLLDLNAASASDLDALPGIGPVLAQRIVDWRTENGRFASVDQLREVTGIGEAKFQDLRDAVVV